MKVWELIAKLSECPAGATVNVGIWQTMNVEANEFERDGIEVIIRSSEDVKVCSDNGDTVWLSSLIAVEE